MAVTCRFGLSGDYEAFQLLSLCVMMWGSHVLARSFRHVCAVGRPIGQQLKPIISYQANCTAVWSDRTRLTSTWTKIVDGCGQMIIILWKILNVFVLVFRRRLISNERSFLLFFVLPHHLRCRRSRVRYSFARVIKTKARTGRRGGGTTPYLWPLLLMACPEGQWGKALLFYNVNWKK